MCKRTELTSWLWAAVAFAALGCTPPAAVQLAGTVVAPIAMPRAELPRAHRLLVFRWEYVDGNALTRGEGAVRLAPPDSARLDLFLAGFGGGSALLIGDSLIAPLPAGARAIIPPAPMLWAAFGRLAVPAATDTVVRAAANEIRADIGREPVWRATFAAGGLIRVEHIERGRVLQQVERAGSVIRYRRNATQRRLTLTITRDEQTQPFDPSIWRL